MLRHACPFATFNDSKSSVDLFFLAVRREALSARCPARVCVCVLRWWCSGHQMNQTCHTTSPTGVPVLDRAVRCIGLIMRRYTMF